MCLEARDRTGGRLATTDDGLDLGVTWFWDGEPRVAALAARLDVAVFDQHLVCDALAQHPTGAQRVTGNPIDVPAHRYRPGAAALTSGLAAQLPDTVVRLSTSVAGIRPNGGTVEVRTTAGDLNAGQVVLAIPPALAMASIDFQGALEAELAQLAAGNTMHRVAGHPGQPATESARLALRAYKRDRAEPAAAASAKPRPSPSTRCAPWCPPAIWTRPSAAVTGCCSCSAWLMGRRSELVALQRDDVREVAEGLEVTIRTSKTDKDSAGETIAIPRGSHPLTNPVAAWRDCLHVLDQAGHPTGRLLRRINGV
ncbi:FAD-dependent oxidoreductase [Nonomuraea ceibae]|uniref:FAD-dependent oxidoreductase n=1 Tax=Nonomuraea ceibae TaxID=1935170 RepID=UPI001FE759EE|nr:FAD-dependent oxidoreductase [Nonomuraea ceibae]